MLTYLEPWARVGKEGMATVAYKTSAVGWSNRSAGALPLSKAVRCGTTT